MPQDDNDEQYNKYMEDSRIPCQYGVKCYQKNPMHHKKYKHPPKSEQEDKKKWVRKAPTGQKRKADNDSDDIPETSPCSPQVKHLDKKLNQSDDPAPECSSSSEKESEKMDHLKTNDSRDSEKDSEGQSRDELSPSSEKEIEKLDSGIVDKRSKTINSSPDDHSKDKLSPSPEKEIRKEKPDSGISDKISETITSSPEDNQRTISNLFLTEMPQDFYQLYEFCKKNSQSDPTLAFKIVDIKLVGPFDVLTGKLSEIKEKDDCLRHWRYYYDPPEFQTVLKGNDKDGMHFGYWRDNPSKAPVFVAKNNANVSCKIVPVAENLFGALDSYLEERTKLANPFEKATIARLHQKLKSYAKEQKINLEKHTPGMREREKKVVARTLHSAGIIVPYDRKTQVGYRKMAVGEADLKKIFKRIEDAQIDEKRRSAMTDLQEVVRWATIAADECDFGTCLELGHDLFSSGLAQVQDLALQMLSIAYDQLERPEFLNIARVHIKERKKGSSLSIL